MIACVDLFCGVGGLTHGLARGGINVVAGVDVDAACRFPYESNNAAKYVQHDVRTLKGRDIRKLWPSGSSTLLAGCAPCQSFSTYTRKVRKGRRITKDGKWELVAEFARLIDEASPDYVTMENVPQLRDHRVFQQFISAINKYHVWHDVIECSEYGVPQTRKRLVLLASKAAPIALAKPKSNDGKHAATVLDAIGKLPGLSAGQADPNDSLHSACNLTP